MRPTAAQKRNFDAVQSLGCIICGRPAQIHHISEGCGMGQRDHSRVIGLCLYHHLGGSNHPAIHANKKAFEEMYGTESELEEKVKNLIERKM
ncbi:MAG: DUF968 domain-containing protein [Chlorobium sp.]|nr:DUF968 domain-containing protein [Chlorobium sp.]